MGEGSESQGGERRVGEGDLRALRKGYVGGGVRREGVLKAYERERGREMKKK